ncbi:nuclear GTP-binding protein nug1 [Elasticomyces elasticus]|nr:nuclear GTP-binding protein nug1 [Elasticomyces elasticus]
MRIGKPQSKRGTVRLRHKIEKASVAKQAKGRKEAKKNPQWKSRIAKDPGIPNQFPYKAKVLAEIEEARRRKTEEAQRRKDVAKAQRTGTVVPAKASESAAVEAEDEDEILLDEDEDVDEEMEEEGSGSNPMAALLASAQARAQAYSKEDAAGDEVEEEDDDDESEEEDNDWSGIKEVKSAAPSAPTRKALPKQALADPIKSVTALLERMQKTQDGIKRLIEHYQIPMIVTTSNDTTSRFLVEVARKRGRLGRGGVPNLNAAALTVLSDLNEERLQLPAEMSKKPNAAVNKGEVQIVSQMAQPFRIEGLFGKEPAKTREESVVAMDVEA